jgi:HTH-type transcriptional regulator/antitoxin HigA
MSIRHDRIDNFWFVLRHECEHVLQNHGQSAAMLDTELEKERAGTGNSIPEEERIANEAAAEFCVPQSSLNKFISVKAPFFAERDIIGFARTVGVHPGLIAGQLQNKTGRYDLFRNHLAKIRSAVVPNAMADGWGDVAPVGQ